LTSDPLGSFTTAERKSSCFWRNRSSLEARASLPRSGPPLTTTRVGSPPVWESITCTRRVSPTAIWLIPCPRRESLEGSGYFSLENILILWIQYAIVKFLSISDFYRRAILQPQENTRLHSFLFRYKRLSDIMCDILPSRKRAAFSIENGLRERTVFRHPAPVTALRRGGQTARADHPGRNP